MNNEIKRVKSLPKNLKKKIKLLLGNGVIVYELESNKIINLDDFFEKYKDDIRVFNIDKLL